MALSRRLRDDICKRNRIKQATFYNYVRQKLSETGAPSMDVAGLLLAQDSGIDVTKPRYGISKQKIDALQEFQSYQPRAIISVPAGNTPATRKKLAQKNAPFKRFLKFQGKYPDQFFDRLEREINLAYNNPDLPNALMMLSRKLIENLVYRLLQEKFHGPQILLYFDTAQGHSQDFSVLLENLKQHKRDFPPDIRDSIDKFLSLVNPFRVRANADAHKIIEYLEKTSEIKIYKIPEMAALLLNLIKAIS